MPKPPRRPSAIRKALARPVVSTAEELEELGRVGRFAGDLGVRLVRSRGSAYFGETLRQAGLIITGSTIVLLGLVFIIGLQCGVEGAYVTRSFGAPSYAGFFAAWCDLREFIPYAFGYMMAAKVGTGIVAEIGAMRISDEIDAMDVIGLDSRLFLCGTRVLAAALVLPFVYLAAIGVAYVASFLVVVLQIGGVSKGAYLQVFWQFQNPADVLYSFTKAMTMTVVIVIVGCFCGYTARGGPVGVGRATARSMVLNVVLIHVIGMLGTQLFWGINSRAPIGG